ncbi:SGNH hydrolase domain-containing protein [Mycobacterium sp. 141]|uniref:SGNH hydrolase domain-containing protein n=1 Tax=Mycobacterium sp. 141 TaxID=1120797 RepID=UPI00035CE47D|nr:SGNH hydrolase domain-containing protein [Mycobacterium sp. 141]
MSVATGKGFSKPTRRSVRRVATALAVLAVALTACSGRGSDPNIDLSELQSDGTGSTPLTNQTYATTDQVLAAVAAAQQTQTLPETASEQLVKITQQPSDYLNGGADYCFDRREVAAPAVELREFGECAYGDHDGGKLMVLFGDSRGETWSSALERVAAVTGWKLRIFDKHSCPVADLPLRNLETGSPDADCDTFRAAAIDAIRELKPQLVVTASHAGARLANGDWPTQAQWQDGWTSTLGKLAQPGTRLAVLGAYPEWKNSDARCLAAHTADVQQCSTDRADVMVPQFESEKAAAAQSDALYVDTVPWVCAQRCEPVVADIIVYNDPYHFTKQYSNYLSGAVMEALKPAMA